MINVSNSFKEELNNDNRNYLCFVTITLSDETELNIENDKIWNNGISFERAVSGDSSFDIGSVIINKATIVLNNIYDDFSKYDFSDAKVYIEIGLELENGSIEKVKIGTFYVDDPKYNGSIITLDCLDKMSNFDKNYSESNLTYPATLLQIVQDACSVCNVNNGISSLPNGDYVVNEKPNTESLTFRQMLQWVGQICCQWFTIDENDRLVSGWFNTSDYESMAIISGGNIGEEIEDLINAGTFGNSIQNYISSGSFGENVNYHVIESINSFNVDTDDVVITGLKVTEYTDSTEEDPETVQYGEDGYVLEISENKLIKSGNANLVANYVGSKIVGLRFRPFSITCQNDPTIEAGDLVVLRDYKGNLFQSFVTNLSFSVGSSESISCGAVSAKRNSASRYSKLTQAYVDNRKAFQNQKTEWEKAMDELSDRINNSSGLYITSEKQSDGSYIYYMHDKPTLEESMMIWKMTAEAMAVSSDGGKTYNAGLTVDGTLITKIMNTIGLNFDWGVGGTLIIRDKSGKETLYVDSETGTVRIVASSFSLSGKTVQEIAEEEALSAASKKNRVFVTTPVPPYDVGDLWVGNSSSDLKRCQTARSSGNYVSSDWIKAVKYTDDSAVTALDDSLTQEGVFNRLTNNGKTQGIYLQGGKIYINATFIKSGTLVLGGSNNGNGELELQDDSGQVIGTMNNEGVQFQGNFTSLGSNGRRSVLTSGNLGFYKDDEFYGKLDYCNVGGIIYSGLYSSKGFVFAKSQEGVSSNNGPYVLILGNSISDSVHHFIGKIKVDTKSTNGSQYICFVTNDVENGVKYYSDLYNGIFEGNHKFSDDVEIQGGLYLSGSKSRIAKTQNYGDRLLYCYEMPSPMFGDIGEARIDSNGECYIFIDDIFSQTINSDCEYQVFLQKEGKGDLWIDKKEKDYFIVKGDPNLKFAWEIKAKQKDFEYERIDPYGYNDGFHDVNYQSLYDEMKDEVDYEEQALTMMREYYEELEVSFL